MQRLKVLLLDAGNQNTLAITRRLGKTRNVELHLVGFNRLALSFFSRYCSKKYILPHPSKREAFVRALLQLLEKNKYDILFPVGNYSFDACSMHYEELSKHCRLLVPSASCFAIAASKKETYQLAASCGVDVPAGYTFESREMLLQQNITFPVVVKAPVEMGKNVVEYAYNRDQLIRKFDRMCLDYGFGPGNWPIVQQYIKGDGFGYFAFYSEGRAKADFMHRRIREYPVTGGASTCAIAVQDEQLRQQGQALLDRIRWNGVAMVEFKRSEADGKFYLMEINPKFWGSLELALTAGVDFPGMVIDQLTGKPLQEFPEWKKVRFQWLLNGELFHFFERPSSFFRILRDCFRSSTDFYWSDPLPNLVQVLMIFRYFVRKFSRKK